MHNSWLLPAIISHSVKGSLKNPLVVKSAIKSQPMCGDPRGFSSQEMNRGGLLFLPLYSDPGLSWSPIQILTEGWPCFVSKIGRHPASLGQPGQGERLFSPVKKIWLIFPSRTDYSCVPPAPQIYFNFKNWFSFKRGLVAWVAQTLLTGKKWQKKQELKNTPTTITYLFKVIRCSVIWKTSIKYWLGGGLKKPKTKRGVSWNQCGMVPLCRCACLNTSI